MPRVVEFWADTIGPTLDRKLATVTAEAEAVMQHVAEEMEGYAQQNAPWEDRTGEARSGLAATVFEDGGEIVIELAYSVDYGYWLEVIQNGRFAIVLPTIELFGPQAIKEAGGTVLAVRGV